MIVYSLKKTGLFVGLAILPFLRANYRALYFFGRLDL